MWAPNKVTFVRSNALQCPESAVGGKGLFWEGDRFRVNMFGSLRKPFISKGIKVSSQRFWNGQWGTNGRSRLLSTFEGCIVFALLFGGEGLAYYLIQPCRTKRNHTTCFRGISFVGTPLFGLHFNLQGGRESGAKCGRESCRPLGGARAEGPLLGCVLFMASVPAIRESSRNKGTLQKGRLFNLPA